MSLSIFRVTYTENKEVKIKDFLRWDQIQKYIAIQWIDSFIIDIIEIDTFSIRKK